jgi:hypothetical protein
VFLTLTLWVLGVVVLWRPIVLLFWTVLWLACQPLLFLVLWVGGPIFAAPSPPAANVIRFPRPK